MYTIEIYSAVTNEIYRKWMDLENITLNEVIQDQKDKMSHSFLCDDLGY